MDTWLPALPLLLSLLLGLALRTQACDLLDYCRPPRICPNFTHISTNQKYEERLYEPSVWMCTTEEGIDSRAVAEASIRLINFRNYHSWVKGVQINPHTWPSLVSVNIVENRLELSLCWMVPPGVTVSGYRQVTVKTIPRTAMFVRSFSGIPTFENSGLNALRLMEDLLSDGKRFDRTVFFRASYDSPFGIIFFKHNEIWIPKA
uniref:Heme-binding protein 2 n=1 Tax=Neogobius melanostomus TaxID=47308 RepID=A0A8C6SC89_9GOBI